MRKRAPFMPPSATPGWALVSQGSRGEGCHSHLVPRICFSPEPSVLEVPSRNTEKHFIFLALKVSQRQSRLANNLQAEVIISVWDHIALWVCVAWDRQKWQDLPLPGTSHLMQSWHKHPADRSVEDGRRQGKAEGVCVCNTELCSSSGGSDLKRWQKGKEVFGWPGHPCASTALGHS